MVPGRTALTRYAASRDLGRGGLGETHDAVLARSSCFTLSQTPLRLTSMMRSQSASSRSDAKPSLQVVEADEGTAQAEKSLVDVGALLVAYR
jgi:hypothetical protein